MNECQVWWTLTGNFGNMMPIDWSKSTARAKQLETLNLCNPKTMHPASRGSSKLPYGRGSSSGPCSGSGDELEDEDDMVAADLDMHSLILTSNPQENSVSFLQRLCRQERNNSNILSLSNMDCINDKLICYRSL